MWLLRARSQSRCGGLRHVSSTESLQVGTITMLRLAVSQLRGAPVVLYIHVRTCVRGAMWHDCRHMFGGIWTLACARCFARTPFVVGVDMCSRVVAFMHAKVCFCDPESTEEHPLRGIGG